MRYENEPFMIYPSGLGAHAWMPMSFSPDTGLVYIPAMHAPIVLSDNANYERRPGRWNTGVTMGGPPPKGQEHLAAFEGWLVAWDPVKQEAAWKIRRDWPWNGGTLATAGNLVFQGDAYGQFHAYDARDGKELWSFDAGRGVLAGPITYRVDGVQYVAVLAGYGGSMGMARPSDWMQTPPPPGMLLVFRLGGTASLPPRAEFAPPPFAVSEERFTPAQLAEGEKFYFTYCSICHAGPTNPDLPRSAYATDADAWRAVLIDGVLADNGMASFADQLSADQAEAVRAYVLEMAKEGAAAEAR